MSVLARRSLGGGRILKPARVADVVIGDAVDLSTDELLRNVFYLLSGHTGINASAFAAHTFQYYRAGGYNGITFHHCLVHYDRTHAYEHVIVNGASVDDSIVTDGYIITY